MPTRENSVQLESLLDATSALVETKKVVDRVDQEIRVLKLDLGEGRVRVSMLMLTRTQTDAEGEADAEGETNTGSGTGAPTPMNIDEAGTGRATMVGHIAWSVQEAGGAESRYGRYSCLRYPCFNFQLCADPALPVSFLD